MVRFLGIYGVMVDFVEELIGIGRNIEG